MTEIPKLSVSEERLLFLIQKADGKEGLTEREGLELYSLILGSADFESDHGVEDLSVPFLDGSEVNLK